MKLSPALPSTFALGLALLSGAASAASLREVAVAGRFADFFFNRSFDLFPFSFDFIFIRY